jgi:adenylosuccinate lyase
VEQPDKMMTEKAVFKKVFTISGRIYRQKVVDIEGLLVLASLGVLVYTICIDKCSLVNFKKMEEPFAKQQNVLSEMPYQGRLVKKLKTCLPYYPAIPLLDIYLKYFKSA